MHDCRFHFPFAVNDDVVKWTLYDVRRGTGRSHVLAPRNNSFINRHPGAPQCVLAWGGNTDSSFIDNETGAAVYVASYIDKHEAPDCDVAATVISRNLCRIEGAPRSNLDIYRAVVSGLLNSVTVGAPNAIWVLLNFPFFYKSREIITVNTLRHDLVNTKFLPLPKCREKLAEAAERTAAAAAAAATAESAAAAVDSAAAAAATANASCADGSDEEMGNAGSDDEDANHGEPTENSAASRSTIPSEEVILAIDASPSTNKGRRAAYKELVKQQDSLVCPETGELRQCQATFHCMLAQFRLSEQPKPKPVCEKGAVRKKTRAKDDVDCDASDDEEDSGARSLVLGSDCESDGNADSDGDSDGIDVKRKVRRLPKYLLSLVPYSVT